jgi:pimeloyl-ACP methyl ester carboxylesterase
VSASTSGALGRAWHSRGTSLPRRRAVQALAAAGVAGVSAALGVGGLMLADWAGADEDDGRPLHLETFGTGERTLAFLPGHGLTTRYFASRVAPLAARHRVVLVDLLGFGRSPKPWTRYTADRHVAELRRVLAPLGPLTLVGHSLGARLAVTYAARYPDQVRCLVLLSLPYFGGAREAYRHFAHGELPGRWVSTRRPLTAVACVLIRRVLYPFLPRLEPDLPREVVEDVRLHHWRSDVSTLRECLFGYDLPADVARLAPALAVLCLHGSDDRSAPIEGVRRFAARHPNTTVRVLEGADHHPLLRDPARCVEEIRAAAVLDENPAGGRPEARP